MVTSPVWRLAVAVILGLTFTLAHSDKTCNIGRYGTVSLFNGESLNVTLPCKYRLADFTCGDYRVKVTPGSAADSDVSYLFSPATLWVKVVNIETKGHLEIRTSLRKIKKFHSERAWQTKDGSTDVVDVAGYDSARGAAVLRVNDVFSVEFSASSFTVRVTCSSDRFVSRGLPATLCGSGTASELRSIMARINAENADVTTQTFVDYTVLNDHTVTQSKTCKGLASQFQRCKKKGRASLFCHPLTDASSVLHQCLAKSGTPLEAYYSACLRYNCDGDKSALDPALSFAKENCGIGTEAETGDKAKAGTCFIDDGKSWLGRRCGSDKDCPAAHSECVTGQCLCRPGFYFSASTACCVETCEQFYKEHGRPFYLVYLHTAMTCPEEGLLGTDVYGVASNRTHCYMQCSKLERCAVMSYRESEHPFSCTYCSLTALDPRVTLTPGPGVYTQKACV